MRCTQRKKQQRILSSGFGSSEQILRALLCTILPALGSMLLPSASGAQQKNARMVLSAAPTLRSQVTWLLPT